ncbi:MAG: nucleoside triphosphate pyrophosphohydrolase, partial [Chloroflexi bacterium]|nr:nucleoside triphosphate pyrophosphohydrolase [Chloroflexota bacterium]
RYPATHRVALVCAPGDLDGAPVIEMPLAELARAPRGVGVATLYVPSLAPLDAVSELTVLRAVVARLRAPGGCPWDREQTHESLKQYLVEETYEVLEALESGDPRQLAEELGDVLLQVVLHAQLAAEDDEFDMESVLRAITAKLIRRHPHVFGSASVTDADEVVRRWEQLKQGEEESAERSLLDSVPRHLPALAYAQAIQRKVARYGFDWPALDGVLDKVAEEVAELRQAADDDARRREAGDLLFAVVNALRWLKVDAEEALRQANRRFGRRFRHMEELAAQRELDLARLSLADLDALWDEAKEAERVR